ncbi:Vacuolar morphogenesis protein 6 [Coemansia thaxteri]|uniref:Vacuolar morphogenesis protein 6 n=1 Tax=Coemansia thaxteri TaxID=2663907 RepID=A0A9W8EIA2_9FUNG|nr:Vacuolar morphogenesis protein 6 [Coemansia thaxteri]
MHNAFDIRAVLRQLPVRIESAAAYSDRLLLGTSTGALLMYRVVEPTKDRPLSISLTETKKAFARKAIEHLDVVKEAGVLVCLADGLVTLYDLHSFSSATPLTNTKGANLVAVHTAVDHIDNIPTLVSKLAVHAKRKLVVLEWRDAEFYKSHEYSAADKITAMQFASANLLVLSTAREFLTLQLPQGQWDDLFPADTASMRTIAVGSLAAIPAIGGTRGGGGGGPESAAAAASTSPSLSQAPASSGAGGGGSMWGSWGLGLSSTSTEVKTIIARMPGEKLLLCHEDIGVFINSAGKLCRQEHAEPTQFTFVPTGITHTSSYVIAISSEHGSEPPAPASALVGDNRLPQQPKSNVEVRNMGTQALVQALYLSDEAPTHVFSGSGGKQVWAVGLHTVWRLLPVPIQQQVEDVLGAGQYDEALSLVTRSDSILESEKEDLTIKIRWLRARWLFREQAKYEEALSELTDLGATPTEAIALCPERIAGELAEESSDAEDEPGTCANTSGKGDDQQQPNSDSGDTGNTLVKHVNRSLKAKPKQVMWKEALFAVMRYLTEHRQWLQRAAADGKRELKYVVRVLEEDMDGSGSEDTSEHASGNRMPYRRTSNRDDDSLPHVRLKRLAFSLEDMDIPVAAMAQVVDTTLLKIYLECSPGLLGPLLRVKNHCDVEQSEGLLMEHRRFTELVDLYHGKGLYRKALQLLHTQGMSVDGGALRGTYPTVRYLLRLPADQFELVLEYIRWPLQHRATLEKPNNPDDDGDSSFADDDPWPSRSSIVAMVFADDRPAAEEFPRFRVASFLRAISPTLAIQYLTFVFETWGDQTGILHDDMVAAHLDMVVNVQGHSPTSTTSVAIDADYPVDGLRQQLQRFLRSSTRYSPEKALARLPDDDLLLERALVLSRLGRHEHALNLLVFGVASLTLAEQYCVDNVGACAGVFVLLLKILLGAPPIDVEDHEAALLRSGGLFGAEGGSCATAAQVESARQAMHRQFVGYFLSAHHQSIPAFEALRLLPADMDFTADLFDQAQPAISHPLILSYRLPQLTPSALISTMQTATVATFALAVAGAAFAAAPEPTHAVKGKAMNNAGAAEARTQTVTVTVNRNGATANQVSFAAAALAGAIAFASYI